MAWENYNLDTPFERAIATANAISLNCFTGNTGRQSTALWGGGTSFASIIPYGVEKTLLDLDNEGGHLIITAYQQNEGNSVRITVNINGSTRNIASGWYTDLKLAFGINTETQRGQISLCALYTSDYQMTAGYVNGVPNYDGLMATLYNIFINAPAVTYNWQSVPSISGKNGILLLSTIKSDAINSGDPVSGASADVFDSLVSTSKLSTLASGKTEETPVAYSDDENYMAIKDNGDNTCDLRFYLEGQSLLKIQNASQNAYLSMLEDDTNQVVKPSIIYKSGNTYSYNTESPSSDTMENLYNWLHIQTRKKENKTGRWSTSFTFSRVEE